MSTRTPEEISSYMGRWVLPYLRPSSERIVFVVADDEPRCPPMFRIPTDELWKLREIWTGLRAKAEEEARRELPELMGADELIEMARAGRPGCIRFVIVFFPDLQIVACNAMLIPAPTGAPS